MGLVFGQKLFQRGVDRCISAIVADLKDALPDVCRLKQLCCVLNADRKRLFAKDMLPCLDGSRGYFAVSFVRRAYQNRVAIIQQFFPRRTYFAADSPRGSFSSLGDNVVQRRYFGSL